MKKHLLSGAAFAALIVPGYAFAQSSGTVAADEVTEIVVTGSRTASSPGVEGVSVPDSPKARTVLNNEYLRTQNPGQSILQAINIVPSVNFTNNDPFGSSGGNVRIRGFDGNRISFTWDGLPLNDTGNYAIFSNQAGDPEIVDSVNVNQGTTDVDSPTAASSGGTINYRTITPSEEFGAMVVGAYGQSYQNRNFYRTFGMIQTGDILGTGVRGFVSASGARNAKFRGFGNIDKEQFNARLYKTLGTNGDFIALAGHYNRNRNNSYRALTLSQASYDLAVNGRYTFDNNGFCVRPAFVGGTAQNEGNGVSQGAFTLVPTSLNSTYQADGRPANAQTVVSGQDQSCTNYVGSRLNPSNTGNARFNSRFTLTDKLTLTVDAGYQYVLANGGGFFTQAETDPRTRAYAVGVTTGGKDLSGDGDILDTVALYAPNTTNTNRYTLLASLRYDFAEGQSFRIAYALDYGRHRQTGEYSFFDSIGNPSNVFGGRGGTQQVTDSSNYFLRARDRFSIAELNQVSGEYRGKFFDNRLEVQLGVRAPFFYRQLNQFCYTIVSSGNPLCTSTQFGTTPLTIPTGGNANNFLYVVPANFNTATGVPANALYAPFRQVYKYQKVLPNIGFTFRPVENITAYGSYAKGLSAPRTDNLYRGPFVGVAPETTDNFDVGVRYNSAKLQATFGGFYNKFANRIVTSFDDQQGISVDRNVGRVEIKGLEATVNVRPVPWFNLYAYGSYIDAKLKDNIRLGTTVAGVNGATVTGLPIVALTAGKRLVETPEWQYGARAVFLYGPARLGIGAKRVTPRFATDVNDVIIPGYTVVDVDARVSLKSLGMEKTFVQLNVSNLFDKQYLGTINSQIAIPTNFGLGVTGIGQNGTSSIPGGANPTFQPGSPRSFSVSLQVGF